MANPEHLAKLNEGTEEWNQWRASNPTANLSRGEFSGKNLSCARLNGVDLYRANLSGADLREVTFEGSDLSGTNLREANLQGADLSDVKGGLQTEQLAGADLTGAKISKELTKLYDGLQNVNNISESARKLFLAVLAACLYSWLTIATTTDVNLITNRASSPLPIIQTSIPIVGFYWVAPLLLLCVYFYFHFYLQKLWEELGSLPAIFPDGRPLHSKIDPWLLNDLVRAHLPRLNVNRPFLSYLQLWISVLLAWWVVPITMFLFWGRYLVRHGEAGTALQVVLLVVSLVAAVRLYGLAVATLRGAGRDPFAWRHVLASGRARLTAAQAVGAAILLVVVSWEAITGVRPNAGSIPWEEAHRFQTWVPRSLGFIGFSPFANLAGAEVSQKKLGWGEEGRRDRSVVTEAELFGADIRYALAERAFFDYAVLTHARLSGAHMVSASLRNSNLDFADLAETNLSEADLSDASMRYADLNEAHFVLTDIRGADLRDVENLEPMEIRDALHWDQAFYDRRTLDALGLGPDHNKRVAAELGVEEPSDVKVIH